jgi:hypothetical protein
VSAHILILVSTVGALAAAVTALTYDRNVLAWFVLGAVLPGLSLLLIRIDRPSGALVALCVCLATVTCAEAAAIVVMRRSAEQVREPHARHLRFCDHHRDDLRSLVFFARVEEVERNAARLFDSRVMELCGLDPSLHRRELFAASSCWAKQQTPDCYSDLVDSLTKEPQ